MWAWIFFLGASAMSRLDAADRHALPLREFAYIDSHGGEHLPIHDEAHVRNAVARFDQTHFESGAARREAARRIVAAAQREGIVLSEQDRVVQAAA